MGKSRYHHGNVREHLVQAALEALTTLPPEALSLRGLARSIGVSATATYRHFPGKSDLLHELAMIGCTMLSIQLAQSGGRLSDLGKSYIGFAVNHPNLFSLMHCAGFPARNGMGDCAAQVRLVTKADDESDPADDRPALAAWALARGLAALTLAGQLSIADAEAILCSYATNFDSGAP